MRRRDFVKAAALTAATSAAAAIAQQTPAPTAARLRRHLRHTHGTGPRRRQSSPPPMSPATVADLVATSDPHFFTHQQICYPAPTVRADDAGARWLSVGGGRRSAGISGLPGGRGLPRDGSRATSRRSAGSAPARQVVTGSTDRRHMYVWGLERLESEARRRFAKSFAALTADQADALLAPALTPWMTDHPPRDSFQTFVNVMHLDIRTATMNSAPGALPRRRGERAPALAVLVADRSRIERYR